MEMKWSDDGWLKWSRNGLRKLGSNAASIRPELVLVFFKSLDIPRVALISNLPLIE